MCCADVQVFLQVSEKVHESKHYFIHVSALFVRPTKAEIAFFLFILTKTIVL